MIKFHHSLRNWFEGRKITTVGRYLELEDIIGIISMSNNMTDVEGHGNTKRGHFRWYHEQPSQELVKMLLVDFRPEQGRYILANHLVYEGKTDQKHYIKIKSGKRDELVHDSRATISFIVKNNNL